MCDQRTHELSDPLPPFVQWSGVRSEGSSTPYGAGPAPFVAFALTHKMYRSTLDVHPDIGGANGERLVDGGPRAMGATVSTGRSVYEGTPIRWRRNRGPEPDTNRMSQQVYSRSLLATAGA